MDNNDTTNTNDSKQKISAFIPLKEYRELKSALAFKGWTFSDYLLKVLKHPVFKEFLQKNNVNTDISDTDITDTIAT